jgi:hypothetical protein
MVAFFDVTSMVQGLGSFSIAHDSPKISPLFTYPKTTNRLFSMYSFSESITNLPRSLIETIIRAEPEKNM